MISPDLALRAARLLEREASTLYDCTTDRSGDWPADDPEAKQDYDEMMATAAELRMCAS